MHAWSDNDAECMGSDSDGMGRLDRLRNLSSDDELKKLDLLKAVESDDEMLQLNRMDSAVPTAKAASTPLDAKASVSTPLTRRSTREVVSRKEASPANGVEIVGMMKDDKHSSRTYQLFCKNSPQFRDISGEVSTFDGLCYRKKNSKELQKVSRSMELDVSATVTFSLFLKQTILWTLILC